MLSQIINITSFFKTLTHFFKHTVVLHYHETKSENWLWEGEFKTRRAFRLVTSGLKLFSLRKRDPVTQIRCFFFTHPIKRLLPKTIVKNGKREIWGHFHSALLVPVKKSFSLAPHWAAFYSVARGRKNGRDRKRLRGKNFVCEKIKVEFSKKKQRKEKERHSCEAYKWANISV